MSLPLFPRLPAALGLLLLCGAACGRGPGTELDPRPLRLVPGRTVRQVPVQVRIEGENFQLLAVRQLSGGEPVRVERGFQAFLGDTALEGVEWVDAQTLSAQVPAGLAPGLYALTLQGPLGRRVQLERAFLVSASTFGQLEPSAEVDRTELLVGSEAQVALQLHNPGDAPVRDVVAQLQVEGPASVQAVEDAASVGEVPPGGSVTRRWRVRGTGPGALRLRFTVAGTDAESGLPVAAAAPPERQVQVLTPAALVAQGALTLRQVSTGQELEADLTVLNEGDSTARSVQPELQTSGAGAVEVLQAPAPEDMPGGALRTFRWRLRASAAGALDVAAQARGTEALSGAELPTGLAPAGPLLVQWPAALVGSVASSLPRVSVGQSFSANLTVRNAGEALAQGVLPAPPQLGGAGAELRSTPAPQDVPGGEQRTFTWSLQATGPGLLALGTGAQGTDANSGAAVDTGALSAPTVEVQTAASLRAVATPSLARVSLGQQLQVDVEVFNDGQADALAVLPSVPVRGGSGSLSLQGAPTAVTVPGGGRHVFTFVYTAAAAGEVALTTGASGRDANSGLLVDTGPVPVTPVQVQAPAALSASLSVPAQVSVGQRFGLTLTLRNTGGADAVGVTPGLPMLTGTATAALAAGPTPASATLSAGEVRSFGWEYVATSAGTLRFDVDAAGMDANSGAALVASATAQLAAARAAALVGSLVTPVHVDVLQPFDITLTVENTGEAAALGVLPAAPVLTGSAGAELLTAPGAQDVPGGERRAFTWTYRAPSPGDLTFVVEAQGQDAYSGASVATGPVTGPALVVQTPAVLVASASLAPTQVSVGQQVVLELTVSNPGQADALDVQPRLSGFEVGGPLSLVSAPSLQLVPGGSSHVFRWTFAAQRAGSATLGVDAEGTDANTGAIVATGPVGVPTVRVQVPASLSVVASAPAQVSTGQRFQLSLTVRNDGGADAVDVTPGLPVLSGTASATLVDGPTPAISLALAAGEARTFTWDFAASAAGTLLFDVGASGTDANSAAALVAADSAQLKVERAAALVGSLAAPQRVSVDQPFVLTLTVQNAGEALARAVLPVPLQLEGVPAQLLSTPGPQDIPGGAQATFSWGLLATGAGPLHLATLAEGTDANSNAAVGTALLGTDVGVQVPATLRAEAVAMPTQVSLGQQLLLELDVSNDGEADALGVLPTAPLAQGSGALTLVSAPPSVPVTIPGGGSQRFVWTYAAAAAGDVVLVTGASGSDANTGLAVDSGPVAAPSVRVQVPAALTATLAAPAQVSTDQRFSLSLTVRNTGGADALDVTPGLPALSGTGSAALAAGPTPASVTLAAGEARTFTWEYVATQAGALRFDVDATGTDANSGDALALAVPASVQLQVARAAALVGSLVTPGRVDVAQPFVITLTVENTGEAAALGVLPDEPLVTGSATAQLLGAPAAQDIPGGTQRTFTWSYQGTSPGDLTFVVEARGQDAFSGATLSTGPVTDSLVEVQAPAMLAGSASVELEQVSVGQLLRLELTVTNAGQADALGVQPQLYGFASNGPLSLVSAPSADTVPGGGSHVFSWTFAAVSAGSVSLGVDAHGTDANSGAPVATGTVGVPTVRVQAPAALSAQLVAPLHLSVGQAFSVSLEVVHVGEATAMDVTPTLPVLSGAGAALLTAGPVPASVSLGAGQRHTFTWQYTATRAGALRFESGAAGWDFNSGNPVAAPAPAPADLAVQAPAALSAALELEPGTVNVGQLFTVSLSVQNTGEAAAQGVVPQPPVLEGPGAAQLSAGPLPASATVPGGATQVFTWQYTATAAGALGVSTAATGFDANSAAALSSLPAAQVLTVQRPAQLVATLSASPTTVDEDQTVTLTLQVTNAGQTAALDVTPSAPVPSGSSGTLLLTSPSPASVTLPGGASHTFTWSYRAGSSGGLGFTLSASGTDANTGAAASTGQLSTPTVGVQQPPALVGSLLATPATANEGQSVTLAYTVQNTGEATANAVTPQAPTVSGTSSAVLLSAPSPGSVALAGGASHTFTWSYRVGSAGSLAFTTRALAQGANTAAALQSADASAPVAVQQAAALVGALSAPARVSQGQPFTLTLSVTNGGQSGAQAVTPNLPLLSGVGGATLQSGPTPASATLAAGATQVFTWQYTAGAAGALTFSTAASGTDATSGSTLDTGTLTTAPLTVQPPAALVATLGAAPSSASVGQILTVTLTVQNTGGAQALSVSPGPLTLSGTGAATLLSGPTPALSNIAGGTSRSFSWQYTTTAAGSLRFSTDAHGTDANSGEPIAAAPASSAPLAVQRPAALAAQFGASQLVVNEAQLFTVTLTVQNTGEAAVTGVVPAPPTLSGTSTATRVSGPTPSSATLGGGQSQAFSWQYRAGAAGDLGFASSVTGVEANTGTAVGSAQAVTPTLAVLKPASLVASLSAPAAVSTGQEFTLTLGVTNGGGSSATDVTPGGPSPSGSAGVSLVSGPLPTKASLPGGGGQDFHWTWRAVSAGSVSFQVSASGTDATDGQPVAVGPVSSGSVSVQPPATLASSLSSPAVVGLGETFTVTMTVRNDGVARALGITPSLLAQTGSATAALLSGPTPSSFLLQGGQTKDFTWKYSASSEGSLVLSGNATGTDSNSGAPLYSLVSGTTSTFIRRATEVANDPFGDGTSFAYVFSRNGLLHLGPNRTGTGGVRSNPDGSAAQSFAFSFPKDVTGTNTSDNTSPGPFPSIGAAGCLEDTLACGPDNEAGRGLFFTGRVGGQDWLGVVGAHPNNKVPYVYLTPDDDAVLDFRYVDVNHILSGTTQGVTAARLYGSALYMGYGDSGGNRPALIALKQLPAIPGLDVMTSTEGVDLGLEKFPYLGSHGTPANTAGMAMVDAMAEFHSRLYVANNGGCARTTRTDPRAYKDFPADWADCRPNTADYTSLTSVTVARVNALEPADKAVPQLVPFGERLYMARNTTLGPQLFACTPEATGLAADCEPGDWALVAPNSVGDARLTQFNMPDNARITLLAATSSHLYVGFNNASSGLVIFRTSNPTAKLRSDFRGLLDCPADQATAGCEGLGQNGLGVGATRIFDGTALTFDAKNYLYLTAGTGADPVRVYRIAD